MLGLALVNEGLLSAGSAGELAEQLDRSAKASPPSGVGRRVLVCSFRIIMWRPGWSQTKPSAKLFSWYTWGSGVQDCSRGAQDYDDGLNIPCVVVEPAACCWGVWKDGSGGGARSRASWMLYPDPRVSAGEHCTVSCRTGCCYGCQAGHCWRNYCFLPSLVVCQPL